jgi:hypothetical protein
MTPLRAVAPARLLVRLAATACAAVLFAVPVLTAPVRPVVVVGLAGLLLAGVGIAGPWRWPATAAACVFVVDYAMALWVEAPPASLAGATAFGVALLLDLQSVDLGCRLRGAVVDAAVLRSQALTWLGFGVATAVVVLLARVLAHDLAGSVPFALAPFLAAAGALGVVLAVALAVRGVRRRIPGLD